MENRIKEQFSLFADRVSTNDRVSTKTMRRSDAALSVCDGLLSGTQAAPTGSEGDCPGKAQLSTTGAKLLKIGARIRMTVRKVWVSMASSYPWQGLYQQVWSNLQLQPPIT